MSYKPTGNVQDPAVADELERISQAFAGLAADRFNVVYVAPKRPTQGDVLIADGVHYDPASLGVMSPLWFDGASWITFGGGGGGGGGVTDHGALTGLGDNDHPQYQLVSEKGQPGGYPELDGDGKIPADQLPEGTGSRDAYAFFVGK